MAKAYLIKMATKPLYERNFLPDVTELSKEQQEVLKFPISRNLLVSGPAGSGKTILAIYKYKAYGDKKGELLTFANILKDYLARHLGANSNHEIFSIKARGIFEYVKEISGISVQNKNFAQSAERAARWAKQNRKKIDFIISDETQDFHNGHLDFISYYAKQITLFADDSQTLYDHGHSTTEIIGRYRINHNLQIERKNLTGNYRNQPPVAQFANPFYKNRDKEPLPSAILEGEPEKIRIFLAEHESNIGIYLVKQIKAYVDSIPDKTPKIGILVQDYNIMGRVKRIFSSKHFIVEQANNGIILNDKNIFSEPDPILMTMVSAKGLEFDYVVIPFLDYNKLKQERPNNYEQIIFTAITRARRSITVFILKNQKDFLNKISTTEHEVYKI